MIEYPVAREPFTRDWAYCEYIDISFAEYTGLAQEHDRVCGKDKKGR